MFINDFLSRLEGVQERGAGQWMCRCPAHDDSNASMSVSVGTDGRILVNCFAGCSFESICSAVGVRPADLMSADGAAPGNGKIPRAKKGTKSETVEKKPRKKRAEKMVATYDYHDESGSLVYQICRYEPKTFKVRVWDPDSPFHWSWGFKRFGRVPLLYHLPEVLKAAKEGRIIFVVEGEKDADALRGLGVVATTAPFGAQRPWLPSFSEALRGARVVVICADNDPEVKGKETRFFAGQRRAWAVGRELEKAGVPFFRMVFPDVGETPVKDAADWIAARHPSQEDLAEVLRPWASGKTEWPEEWRFEDEPALLASDQEGEKSVPSPSPVRSPEYKLTKNISIKIEIDGKDSMAESVDYNLFRAWKALKDASESGSAELSRGDRQEITAMTIIQWMVRRGKFFWNEESPNFRTSLYFNSAGELMLIQTDAFLAWLSGQSRINISTPLFKFVMAAIDEAAMDPRFSAGTVPAVICDRRGDALYISNGDSKLARIRDGAIEILPNGADDVVFIKGQTLRPWDLEDGPGADPFEEAALFQSASFESPHGRMLSRLWLLSVFACLGAKPIICFTGKFQSGKTRTAKGIFELIGARPRISSIRDSPNGEKDFWVSINVGGLVCFDNVDSRVKWFADAMQAASTGGSAETRELYKTAELIELKAKAAVMLTSNTPRFATESGLSDRLVIVRLAKTRGKSSDKGLTDDFERRRSASMTWICRTVARAMVDRGTVEQGVNLRHPDFADFAMRCGRALGQYDQAVAALKSGEIDKALFPIQNDEVAREIVETMALIGQESGTDGWTGTAAEISAAIVERLACDDKTREWYSSRRIGKTLDKFSDEFRTILHLERTGKTHKRAIIYELKGEFGEFYKPFLENSCEGADICDLYESASETHQTHPCPVPEEEKKEGGGIEDLMEGAF